MTFPMLLFVLGLFVTDIAVKFFLKRLTIWRYKFGYLKNLAISQSYNYFSSEIPQSFLLWWHYIGWLLSKWTSSIEIARCTFREEKFVFDLFSRAWSNRTTWGSLNCQYSLLLRVTFIKVALVAQKDSVQPVFVSVFYKGPDIFLKIDVQCYVKNKCLQSKIEISRPLSRNHFRSYVVHR